MSGGHYNYQQYILEEIAESIKDDIESNGKDEWQDYSPETIEKFKEVVSLLERAQIYVQRIDWLLSGDDGEKTFHERLEEDLKNLEDV